MSKVVLKAENISKQYRLGQLGTGTISHDLNRAWAKLRGKEDPYLQVGDTNDRSVAGGSDYVWSLKDINFEVKQGEVLGIIGKNGAGKSTLLKILSQVTTPTTGKVAVRGRIAALLEVGTGFHPDLSGRENIYLNGAILGMKKSEIKSKLDEIVDFSGVAKYLDTPVKRYSSGMMVRLGFAVAAHLEPEILIVDEVLAVGDADFQKKCLGKMKDVAGEGRTVLFVSHNMAGVKSLCNKGIVLHQGRLLFESKISEAVSYYLRGESESQNKTKFGESYKTEDLKINEIGVAAIGETPDAIIDENHGIQLFLDVDLYQKGERRHITLVLNSEDGTPLFAFSHSNSSLKLKNGNNKICCTFPTSFLNVGTYFLSFYLIEDSKDTVFVEKDIFSFSVHMGQRELGGWYGREPGFIKPHFEWNNFLQKTE